jgi:glucokinase
MASGSIIGVDMGGTKISIAKVEKNRITKHFTSEISSDGKESQILQELINAIEKIFDKNVLGIGIGVPSVVNVKKGIVYDVQNIPSWREVPVKSILEKHFHKPVYINNDANCFTIGEKYFGKAKKFDNLVGVTLGTGLGAGIIIDNRLYCGVNCGAGEFGTMPYKDSIIEYYCSGQFFLGEYGISGDKVFARAKKGDKTALKIFEKFGAHLGEAIMIIMFAVDPEAIILGGSVSRSFPFFQKAMWERVKTFIYRKSAEHLVVDVSEQPHIATLGAAALYHDAQLSK